MKPWELISEDEPLRFGFRKLQRRVFRVPDGTEKEFYIKSEGRAVCVVALTKDRDVLLAKQFRAGVMDFLHELPGGVVESGEDPLEAARRELLEETGYAPGSLEFLGSFFRCAYSSGVTYTYLALDCERVAEPCLDPAEFIELEILTTEAFRDLVLEGKLTDAAGAHLGLRRLGI